MPFDQSLEQILRLNYKVHLHVRTPGRSPGQVSDLRLKKLQELRELQQLLELNVLTPEEFAEQKAIVLEALRTLTS